MSNTVLGMLVGAGSLIVSLIVIMTTYGRIVLWLGELSTEVKVLKEKNAEFTPLIRWSGTVDADMKNMNRAIKRAWDKLNENGDGNGDG